MLRTLLFFMMTLASADRGEASPIQRCITKVFANKQPVWLVISPMTDLSRARRMGDIFEMYGAVKDNEKFRVVRAICRGEEFKVVNSFKHHTPWITTNHQIHYSLHNMVSSDIGALVGDTVNEGSIEAHIHRDRFGRPYVSCAVRKKDNIQYLFCNFKFKVTFDEIGDDIPPEIRGCRITYIQKPATLGRHFERSDREALRCLEDLSESPY